MKTSAFPDVLGRDSRNWRGRSSDRRDRSRVGVCLRLEEPGRVCNRIWEHRQGRLPGADRGGSSRVRSRGPGRRGLSTACTPAWKPRVFRGGGGGDDEGEGVQHGRRS